VGLFFKASNKMSVISSKDISPRCFKTTTLSTLSPLALPSSIPISPNGQPPRQSAGRVSARLSLP
jgi:hypothetical protein